MPATPKQQAQPGVWMSGEDKPGTQSVTLLRPKSAAKETWDFCLGYVSQLVGNFSWSHEYQATLARMTDQNWRCAHEKSMLACYRTERAKTHDSGADFDKFQEDMERRIKRACMGQDKDVENVTNDVFRYVQQFTLSRESREAEQRESHARLLETEHITRRPTSQPLGKVNQARFSEAAPSTPEGVTDKAWRRCWDEAQACINEDLALRTADDGDYKCHRITTAGWCAASGAATWEMAKRRGFTEFNEKWGGPMDGMKAMASTSREAVRLCQNAQRRPDYRAIHDRLLQRCAPRWYKVFDLPPISEE